MLGLAATGLTLMMTACGGGDTNSSAGNNDGGGDGEAAVESPVDPTTAGSVGVTVAFEGTAPEMPVIEMESEPDCEEKYTDAPREQRVVVNDDGSLANVFVYVKSGLPEGVEFPVTQEAVLLDQDGCRYHAHVSGMMAGQDLTVRNSDPVLHNIHPKPEINRAFNESQPKEGMEFTKTFTRPEVMVPVTCDVHDWMIAYVGVTDHPYHGVTGDTGAVTLDNLPPGEYTIAAWHEEYGEQEQTVTLAESGSEEIAFMFEQP